jgi:Ca2+-binding RTX toxin-like protein
MALTRRGDTVATIKGHRYSEALIGTDGPADDIYGYGGDDIILAGGGADYIEPGPGNDVIDGGSGNNTISYIDYVAPWYVSGLVGLYVDLASGTATTFVPSYNPSYNITETDTFFNIQNVVGSNSNDHISGDGAANWLYGWDGSDELHGRGGADHLLGLDDNDLLDGGSGADVLDGGNGVDTADYGSAPSAVNVSLDSGKGYWGDSAGDTLTLIENLTGSAFDDSLVGDSNANVLDGGKGDDYLKGGGGADTLKGGDGSDTIAYGDSNIGVYVSLYSGAAFNGTATGDKFDSIENLTGSYHGDMLEGDEYVNTLQGLGGDDVLQGYGDADTIDGGDGIDTVIYGGSVLGVTVSLFNGVTHGGDAEGDTLISIENLRGSSYADTLVGNNDANVLEGWGGKDNLKGAGGADTLIGGAAADQMTGGSGGDKFVWEALADTGITSATMDIISDFNAADGDTIDVHSIDADATLPGNQDFTFIGDASIPFTAPGQISWYIGGSPDGGLSGTDTYILLNTDDSPDADGVIKVNGMHGVDAGWFVL